MVNSQNNCIPDELIDKRIEALINQFFKILPLRESEESSLPAYMRSLQRELIGLQGLAIRLQTDVQYITVLSILQYLISHDCTVHTVKTEVFKAISLLKQMGKQNERRRRG